MIREGMTIREAAQEWVNSFNAIPYGIVEKLLDARGVEELYEVTPPSKGDQVYIIGSGGHKYGYIVGRSKEDEDKYIVSVDGKDEELELAEDEFEVQRDGFLPMWGTLWAFSESIDNAWLDNEYIGNGLQAMADCGFRVYEQEDYGFIFGIDGAGYDFYESHWVPLYRARGLHWHDPATEKEGAA